MDNEPKKAARCPWIAVFLAAFLLSCGGGGGGGTTLPSSQATAPMITTHPQSTNVILGETATFSVIASGDPELRYQWKKNGTEISGATSASHTTAATAKADNGAIFTVRVANEGGSASSNGALLAVHWISVGSQPVDLTITEGQTATFTVVADANPTPAYQWLKGGTAIDGATASSYTTPAASIADTGSTFNCRLTNEAGSVTSNPATLTVNAVQTAPTLTATAGAHGIISPSGTFTVASGASQTFTATPDSNYTVDTWTENGSIVQTGSTTYTRTNITSSLTVSVSFKSSISPNGMWEGTTSQGHAITFSVVGNLITSLTFAGDVDGPSCSGHFDQTSSSMSHPISGNSFGWTYNTDFGGVSYTIAGTFDSAVTANGTLDFSTNYSYPLTGICGVGSATWTAQKVSDTVTASASTPWSGAFPTLK